MPTFRSVLAIILKDLEDASRSQALLLILLGPVLLSVFFARSFTSDDLRRPRLVLHDPGGSGLARALRTAEHFLIEEEESWEEARRRVSEGRAVAALSIPRGFDEELEHDHFPRLDLAVDETRPQAAMVREGLRAILREQAGQEVPADVRVEKVRESGGGVRAALLPIWVVFTCIAGLMITSSSLVEEVESGTLSAILATQARFADVVAGKILVGALLAFASSSLVLLLNEGWRGNVPSLGLLLLGGSLAFAAMGCALGLFARGQASASAGASLLYLVLFVPVALADLSEVMRAVSMWTPTWYLYDGVQQALLARAGPPELGLHLAVLAAGTLALGAVCAVRLRRTS